MEEQRKLVGLGKLCSKLTTGCSFGCMGKSRFRSSISILLSQSHERPIGVHHKRRRRQYDSSWRAGARSWSRVAGSRTLPLLPTSSSEITSAPLLFTILSRAQSYSSGMKLTTSPRIPDRPHNRLHALLPHPPNPIKRQSLPPGSNGPSLLRPRQSKESISSVSECKQPRTRLLR